MISLTRFNGVKFYLNAELVQFVETTPDTVITLVNNTKIVVKEPAETVVEKMLQYHRAIRNPQLTLHAGE
jgi:flagellar protein FlbD